MAKFKVEIEGETNRAFFIVEAHNAEQACTLWHAVIEPLNKDRIAEELEEDLEDHFMSTSGLVSITPAEDDDIEYITELDAGDER